MSIPCPKGRNPSGRPRRSGASGWSAPLALALAVVGATAFCGTARAEELYAVVSRTAAPGERALVEVKGPTAGAVELEAFRVEAPDDLLPTIDLSDGAALHRVVRPALAAARTRARRPPRSASASEASAGLPGYDGTLTFVVAASGTLRAPPPAGTGRPGLASALIEVPLPAAGLYVLEVSRGDLTTTVAALVSRIALVTKREPTGLLAFCVDRTTGQPIAEAKVEVRADRAVLSAGVTDGRGLLRLDGRFPATARVVARLADHLAVGDETYYPSGVLDRRVHVMTSQPAYRPGERVEVKGIVRASQDGALSIDPGAAQAHVSWLDSQGKELGATVTGVSSDLGTFATGLDLPTSALTGAGRVVVRFGAGATTDPRVYEAAFRIEAYRTPTFEVSVTRAAGAPPAVLPGAEAAFDVAGAYYAGGPLAGAAFSWTLTYHRATRDLFPTDELARLFFGTEREAFAPRTLASGASRLDAAGRARVAATSPELPEDGFLTLRVVATGPDRTVVAGSGTAGYASAPLTVALRTDRHLYGPEANARVVVRARRADGRPAAGRDAVVATSLVVERDVDARGGAAREGGREERILGTFPVVTNDGGEATIEVPLTEPGRYAVSVAVPRAPDEPAGPPAHAVVHVWVAGERADVGYAGDVLQVIADRDHYEVGDVARVLVLSPAGARPFLFTVEGARIESFDTIALPGREAHGAAAVVEVPVAPHHAPGVYLGVALVDHGHLLATTQLLRVPPTQRLLHPTVRIGKALLDPGETVPVAVAVADPQGRPVVGAEVAVAIVDEALHALYADPFPALAPFFHPLRRNDVRTGGPLDLSSVGFAFVPRPAKNEAVAEGRHGGAVGGSAAPTPPSLPPPGAPAGSEAGPPARSPLADAEAEESARGSPRDAVTRDERENADAPAPSLGAGPPKTGAGVEGPLATRTDFRSAVHWSPTLRTGEDGVASVGPVTFAESVTRWRISAHAVDAATRVGSSATTVRTVRQVLTRVTLPRFLRRDDRVSAPWIVQSHLDRDTDVDGIVTATGAELAGERTQRTPLPAGATRTRDVTLHAPRLGEATVRAEVRTPEAGDASAATIPVLPQGLASLRVVSGSVERGRLALPPLTLPPSAEPGTARLVVSVVPSVAQAVGAALPYLADYPYGCTEQTISRLVPVVVAKAARDAFGAPPSGRLSDLPEMVERGLARLRALQHEDGGFGWWETDATDAYMTAYVVHGLTRAALVMDDPAAARALIDRAVPRLRALYADSVARKAVDDPRAAFVAMALCDAGALDAVALPEASRLRSPLSVAFWLRVAVAKGAKDAAAHLAASLSGSAIRDAAGIRWGPEGDVPERGWTSDPVETTASAAGALLTFDPRHPDLDGAVRWLLAARAGGDHWQSTRDTAAAVAFLTRRAAATGDLGAGRRVELTLNGLRLAPVVVTRENAFGGVGRVVLSASELPKEAIHLEAESDGPCVVSAALHFRDTGPAIEATDAGFSVRRTIYLLAREERDGRPALVRRPLAETVPSGALLDVEVTVTCATAREFVMVTSPFVAGFEPEPEVEAAHGAPAAEKAHRLTFDDRAVFFATGLASGTHVFRHRVRAVHVGQFTALPASAELMYFPDVKGHGAGEAFEVSASGEPGDATEAR